MTSLTARVAAAALAIPLVIATATTATAGSRWTFKSSGSFASTSWMEVGALPDPVLGNYHVGFLEVRGDRVIDVFGEVSDWTCPPARPRPRAEATARSHRRRRASWRASGSSMPSRVR